MRWDFFNGEDRDVVLQRTLAETISRLQEEYGTPDMNRWHKRIFWRYFDPSAAANADPEAPVAADGPDLLYGMGVQLGHIPARIPHNGMPLWTTIMEFGDTPARMLSLIPTGGQSWFISSNGEANPHISDQVMRHLQFDYKVVEMEREAILADLESTMVLSVPGP
jgi:penicillin amidase